VTDTPAYIEASGVPPHGGQLAYKQNFSRLLPNPENGEPLQIVWYFSLTVGQTRTIFCDAGVPEQWIISVVSTSGVQLNIWNGSGPSGDPIVCGGGGGATFRANNEYVTIQARLGSPIGNIIATRNTHVTINPGDVA